MEMALQPPRPLGCRRARLEGAQFRIRPAVGPFVQCKEFTKIRAAPCMAASSDYSRRRQRKSSIPKTKGSTPKGFAPRPQVGTSTQKKDESDVERKEGSGSSSSGEYTHLSSGLTERKLIDGSQANKIDSGSSIPSSVLDKRTNILEERSGEKKVDEKRFDEMPSAAVNYGDTDGQIAEINKDGDGIGLRTKYLAAVYTDEKKEGKVKNLFNEVGQQEVDIEDCIDKIAITGRQSNVTNTEEDEKETVVKTDMDANRVGQQEVGIEDRIDKIAIKERQSTVADAEEEENEIVVKADMDVSRSEKPNEVEGHVGKVAITGNLSNVVDNMEGKAVVESDTDVSGNEELGKVDKHGVKTESDLEEMLIKRKAEMDAQAERKMLESLAVENLSKGSKVFVFPEVVKPCHDIEVFLNKGLSALMNEHDVLIKGAFNGWRWKFFTEKMQKTDLQGDWWSCRLFVPKEAYRIDFVFFNGGNVYENNNARDFFLPVVGGMDESAFEDFLLEEKRRELEKLAAEQAEWERQAEEQRRREAEKAASEADRAQAKSEVEKKREAFHRVKNLAMKFVDGVWHIEPSAFKGGDRVRLYYNRSSRPLAHATDIWLHGGHNNWSQGLSIVERLLRSDKKDGDWWYAEVILPDQALVLDWVFADGPPQKAAVYDNNNYVDFHASVPKSMPEELFWVEEEHRIYRKLQEQRKLQEEAMQRKAEKTARMKSETKERTMKMFLLSQKHIVYTEPLDVHAGSTVTVVYNPSNTVLNGKPEVWIKCSFNRWTHRNGPLPPQKMVPADSCPHVKATVKVPLDAYMMDFVFSEREDGGIYDNKNGMDYHIPVTGGILKEPPMHIVHIAVEMAPIAKVGGLGDVVTSLSRAVQDFGHNVDIILPKYDCMNLSNVKDFHFRQSFGWEGTEIKVWFGKVAGLSVYFLEPQNGMFSAGCIYGRNDDANRFGFFCHAALEFLVHSGSRPDILHCHDWSSAPVAWLFKEHYMHYGLTNARVIFTIHNLEFGVHQISKAMTHADKATTVSHTYSKEVSGNPAIAPHLYKFHGILNGIDPDIWDPYNDNFIPVSYTSENVVECKKAAKEALQQRLGLRRSEHPLVGIITRLTVQKGIHLIKHAIWRTLDRNGQVVLLGSAPDPRIQNDFVNLANQLHSSHGDSARFCLTYDEPLSHLIYAGADFILVPSLFEPCGLTQLIAMRYGSIPIVRKTGGLYDTVFDVDNDKERAGAQGLEPNGFSFDGADPGGVDYALNRAISAWYDGREWFNSLCKHVMEQDWSWNRPALDYMELYHAARKY